MASAREVNRYLSIATDAVRSFWNSARRQRWQTYGRVYAGRPRDLTDTAAAATDITVNATFAVIDNIVPMLVSKDPVAVCSPLRPGDERRAKKRQLWLNQKLYRTRLRRRLIEVAYDAAIYGIGYLKIGLTGQAKTQFDSWNPPPRPRNEDAPVSVSQQIGGDLEGEDEATYQSNQPWVRRVAPNTVFPTPGYTKLDQAPYMVHRILQPVEKVKRCPFYRNTRDLKATVSYQAEQTSSLNEESIPADEKELVEIYEIWDRERQRVVTVCEGQRKELRDDPWPFPGLEDFPVKALVLNQIPNEFYGLSYVELMLDHQYELNIARSFMLEHVKRSIKALIVQEGFFNTDQLEKLQTAPVWGIIEAQNVQRDKMIEFPQGPSFDPNIYSIDRTLMEGIRLITGLADFQLGTTTKTKSATEANMMGDALSSRVMFKQTLFDEFTSDVMRAVDQIAAPAMTEVEWTRITGPQGMQWMPITAEDCRAQVDVEIEAGSTRDRREDPVRTEQQLKLLNILVPLAGAVPMDLAKLAADVAEASGIRDPSRYLPSEQEQVPPEEENLLMQTGQEPKIHPMDQDQQHMQVHGQAMMSIPMQYQPILTKHLTDHQQALMAKQATMGMQQAGGMMQGMTGGPEAVRMGDRSSEGGSNNEGAEGGTDLGMLLKEAVGGAMG